MKARLHELCRSVHSGLHDLLNLFLPRYCPVCQHPLNTTESCVCGGCLLTLPYIEPGDFYDNPTARLFWGKIPIERVYCFMKYADDLPSRPLVHALKYYHRAEVGLLLGRMMARFLQPRGFFEGVDCIIPVPLHWWRQFGRGYNQSEKLARGVAEVTGLPVLNHKVVRLRNNPTQTQKTVQERIANTRNLFQAHGPFPVSHILLVDDILTTGSTLCACADAIHQAAPDVRISILSLAQA